MTEKASLNVKISEVTLIEECQLNINAASVSKLFLHVFFLTKRHKPTKDG